MSLEFVGYSCKVKCNKQEIGSGFSEVGPLCSPTDALQLALNNKEVKEMIEKTDSLYWTRFLEIEFNTGTSMPSHRQPELPKMYNLEKDTLEYNRRVDAFMQDLKRICFKHGLQLDPSNATFDGEHALIVRELSGMFDRKVIYDLSKEDCPDAQST
jgi:hypothetical protein